MNNVRILSHPLIEHHLSILRNRKTSEFEFRNRLHFICELMAADVTRDLPTMPIEVETPLEVMDGHAIACHVILVSILRAGLGMQDPFLRLFPEAKVGHIGLYRNEETLQPVSYYENLPDDLTGHIVILLDPMLATGGSICAGIDLLKKHGAGQVKCVGLVAAPEGIAVLSEKHPDVEIYVAAVDRTLNDKGYILPGLGDAGDRQFRT